MMDYEVVWDGRRGQPLPGHSDEDQRRYWVQRYSFDKAMNATGADSPQFTAKERAALARTGARLRAEDKTHYRIVISANSVKHADVNRPDTRKSTRPRNRATNEAIVRLCINCDAPLHREKKHRVCRMATLCPACKAKGVQVSKGNGG